MKQQLERPSGALPGGSLRPARALSTADGYEVSHFPTTGAPGAGLDGIPVSPGAQGERVSR